MTRIEKARAKFYRLQRENMELKRYIQALETDYNIITDQYMNGDFYVNSNIGSIQRRYNRAIASNQRKLYKNEKEMRRLQCIIGEILNKI